MAAPQVRARLFEPQLTVVTGRRHHELAFEGYVAQGAGFQFIIPYSDPRLHELMGGVDMLNVSGYAAQVSGTGPFINLHIQHSNDRNVWYERSFFPAINGLALSTTAETLFAAVDTDTGTSPKYAYARLGLELGGTNAAGFFRVWVTGRDFSRRSGTSASAAARARPSNGGQAMAPRASNLSRMKQ